MNDIDEQIKQAVASGLKKNAIEALLGIKFNAEQLELYRKAKAIYDLKLRKRRQERKYEHLSGAEVKRKFDDKAASIDAQLDEAFSKIDWTRRNEAEKSLEAWVDTYMVPLMLNDKPSLKGRLVLGEMEKALNAHSNYLICMPRGFGKTSYCECATLFAMSTGIQKFVVIVSNNSRAAGGILQDIFRAIAEKDTPYSQDYPEVCFPFHILNGSFRRRQTYRGHTTDLQKNAQNIILPKLFREDGTEFPTSNSILTVRGISGGIRGMKFGKLRPTLVLLDDLQDSDMAENPEQVQKLLSTIRKDIMPLGGRQRLSILNTATPICPEDLVEQLRNDKAWKTTTFKAIEKFPDNMDLWKAYFTIYDSESVNDELHERSLDFYKANKAQMDAGAELFNDKHFSVEDGHISGLQKLLEIQHAIGEAAFSSEYQMMPKKISLAIDITSSIVNSRQRDINELVVPDNFVFVAAATDLNTSYAASLAVVAFKPDMTAHVVHYKTFPSRIDQKLPDGVYAQKVHELLGKVRKHIVSLGIKIDAWAIDAGGKNWDAVTSFTKTVGDIKTCAFAGRASHMFNPFVKSRLRDALNHTVLCGDAEEHVKHGAGTKYVFFDSDYWRMSVQKAFLAPREAPCSCTLFTGEHVEFAMQLTNERLLFIRHCSNGKDMYTWKSREPHDYLDCMAMCYAAAGSQGIAGLNAVQLPRRPVIAKPRIRIV